MIPRYAERGKRAHKEMDRESGARVKTAKTSIAFKTHSRFPKPKRRQKEFPLLFCLPADLQPSGLESDSTIAYSSRIDKPRCPIGGG